MMRQDLQMRQRWRRDLAALVLAGLLAGAGGPATATQEYILPTLFDVTGVAANDVLNIRAAPDANASIIGHLAPDARAVEVVAHDATGRWAQVNAGEQSGWVALRYLAYRVDVWGEDTLPPSLHCLGTEPFWSLRMQGDALVLSTPDAPERVMQADGVLSSGVFRDPRRAVSAVDSAGGLTAVIVPMACSDGMSDRAYGLDATLILDGGGAQRMLTGCCTLAPR
jgi:uncharacterized membrane protein